MEERKFTNEELNAIINCELIYPENKKQLRENLKNYLIKLGAKEDDEMYHSIVPLDYWYEACNLAVDLAYALLRERDDNFHDLNSEIDDIERSVKQLKKILNGRTSN